MPSSVPFQSPPATLRTVPDGRLTLGVPNTFVGLATRMGVAINQRWVLSLGGIQFAAAVGASSRVITSADGSLFALEPWMASVISLLLPGAGVRITARRWTFTLGLEPAVLGLFLNGQMTAGRNAVPFGVAEASFALRADLQVCRRLDPDNRACLFVRPNLYEFGLLNGGAAGVRWEWGP
jgi:hypothetical protein